MGEEGGDEEEHERRRVKREKHKDVRRDGCCVASSWEGGWEVYCDDRGGSG